MVDIIYLKKMCKGFNECNKCPLFTDKLCRPENFPDDIDKIVEKWKFEQDVVKIPQYIYDGICENLCINGVFSSKHICEDYDYNCKECWNSWLADVESEV